MPSLAVQIAAAVFKAVPVYRLKGGIIHRTVLGRWRFREKELRVTTVDGASVIVNPNDFIGRHLFWAGTLDRHVVDVLVAYAQEGDVLWDIGANIGYVSCGFAVRVPSSRIVAVEPQSEAISFLERNLAAAAVDRHCVVKAAVSVSCGQMRIESSPEKLGMARLVEAGHGQQVRVVTGAEIATEAGAWRCDLIKIDVEGHELEVLKGLLAVLKTARPRAIVFECHSDLVLGQITELLEDYRVQRIGRSLRTWHLLPVGERRWGVRGTPDYLAVRRQGSPERGPADECC